MKNRNGCQFTSSLCPFAIEILSSTNSQQSARTFDKLYRVLRILVPLIGNKTSLPGALCIYRKVNPTIYNKFFLISYPPAVLLTQCSLLANQRWLLYVGFPATPPRHPCGVGAMGPYGRSISQDTALLAGKRAGWRPAARLYNIPHVTMRLPHQSYTRSSCAFIRKCLRLLSL